MGYSFFTAQFRCLIFFAAIKRDVHVSYRLSECYRISLRINFALIYDFDIFTFFDMTSFKVSGYPYIIKRNLIDNTFRRIITQRGVINQNIFIGNARHFSEDGLLIQFKLRFFRVFTGIFNYLVCSIFANIEKI